jgi:hypothetical protein
LGKCRIGGNGGEGHGEDGGGNTHTGETHGVSELCWAVTGRLFPPDARRIWSTLRPGWP